MKRIALTLAVTLIAAALAGCTNDANVATENLKKEANNSPPIR